MFPEWVQFSLLLAIGFAVAGLLSSGYQLVADRPPGFRMLVHGARPARFAAIPFLIFAAPFIIIRHTSRGLRIKSRRFEFALLAALLAGFWSLMSGTLVVMTLEAVALLPA